VNRHLNWIALLIYTSLLVGLTSCNLPAVRPSGAGAGTPPPPADTPLPDDLPAVTADQAAASTPSLTLTPVLTLPPDWIAYRTALHLTISHPPDWEAIPYDDHKLDLREATGLGWAEINIVDSTSASNWNLEYIPGMQAQAILNTLLEAAREDGTFEDPHHLLTSDGRTAWFTEGTYDILGDRLLIGVLGLPERAVLLVGHSTGDETEWQRLSPIYRLMMQSIIPES
jgi:hypothetical protein